MIRAPMGDQKYWDARVEFNERTVKDNWNQLQKPSGNPTYRPQFVWDLAQSDIFRLILRRYSRGDAIPSLSQPFSGLLDAWELSNKLAAELNTNLKPGEGWDHRHITPRLSNDKRAEQ